MTHYPSTVFPPWRSEGELARAWAEGRLPGPLRTTWGQEVAVLFPGRPGTDRGPDFRDAVVARVGREPLRGDVEIHLCARGWTEHGHAEDPAYNRVLLHVVADTQGLVSSRRQDGALVPILQAPAPARGAPSGGGPSAFSLSLDDMSEAGIRKFRDRAALLEGETAVWGTDETLYQRLLRALGYSQNTGPFLDIAQAVPLHVLRGMAGALPSKEAEALVSGLLIGTGGFLPSQRGLPPPDLFARSLEAAWKTWGGGASLPRDRWITFRVRPDNHPLRRLGAAAALAERFIREPPVDSALDILAHGEPGTAAARMKRWLAIGPLGYWAHHRDFGVEKAGKPSALLGAERAGEMVVSVLLPFLAAYGAWTGRADIAGRAREAFLSCAGAGDSGLLRWAAGQTLGPGASVRSAAIQQGLLAVAKDGSARAR